LPKKKTEADTSQTTLPFPSENDEHLDISTLETWLLDAANTIRGASDAPKFKDFILPLIFYKRLSDVFDDEFAKQIKEFGDEELAREIVEADHEDALKSGRNPIVRFYIPQEYHWTALRNHPADGQLGEFVTDAMREVARLNPLLQGVLDVKDFNESQSGQRTLDEERLEALIEVLSRHRLGLQDTEPDILGRAYEYLLRKFAEGQGQSAGEFYTPKEVGWLMARLINPVVPMELIPIAKLFSKEFILKTNDQLKSGTYFEPGDILLSKITPSFENGKQCIIKELPAPFGIATTEVIPIREIEGVSDISYLFYYLLLPNVRTSLAGKMEGSTGRQRLRKKAVVNLEIPLPPLPEQRAIANVFQAIDEKIATLEQEVEHLDELFHAMLDELMTGQRSAVPLIDTEMDL
jgi:hypothetical protein